MQNWEHLINVLEIINTIPTKVNSDISRVRQWALNDWAKYYRQTLIFSNINFLEIHSLFSQFCQNFAGQISLTEHSKPLIKNVSFQDIFC